MLQERERETEGLKERVQEREREGNRRGRLSEGALNVILMLTQHKIQWPLVSHFVPFVLSEVHTNMVCGNICVYVFVCVDRRGLCVQICVYVQHCTCFDLNCSSMTGGLKPFNRTLRLVSCNKTPWNDTGLFITVFSSSAGEQKTTVGKERFYMGKKSLDLWNQREGKWERNSLFT